ncbi:MAG: hypothetical protein ABI995_05225 [Acidobacteriota bacterium]
MRLLACLLLVPAAFAADIPNGAHVLLRIQNSINSRTAQVGDYVYMQTATPVSDGTGIVVPQGSHVQGVVAMVERAGKVKGRAQLAIRLEMLTMPSGKQYKFQPRVASLEGNENGQRIIDREGTVKQGSSVGHDVAQVAILAGSGAALGSMVSRVSGGGGVLKGAGIGAGAGTAVGLAQALFTRGRDVELRQGSSLDVVFDQPVELQ